LAYRTHSLVNGKLQKCIRINSTEYYSIQTVSDTQYSSYDRVPEHILVTALVSNF